MNIAFETLAGASDRVNEDWVAASPDAVIVLDGVTAPRVAARGCHHPVSWYTQHLGGRLLTLAGEDLGLSDVLSKAIGQVADLHRDTCNLASPGVPAAAVAMLRKRPGSPLEYLVLADTTIVIETRSDLLVVTDMRVEEAAPEALAATRAEAIGTPEHRAAVAHMSVEQLKRRNVPGGYWVAASDREAAVNAVMGEVRASEVIRVAVFTDGASRIVDTFHEMDWSSCLNYLQEHTPRELIRYVRRIEATDPSGATWPRFKMSDDATAAVVEM